MIAYAVFQEGVYRHDCGGVFDDLEKAKAHARKLYENSDKHHGLHVVPFELNKTYACSSSWGQYRGRDEEATSEFEPQPVFEAESEGE